MQIYLIIASDNNYSKTPIRSYLNKENAFNSVRQLTQEHLEYDAYDALNMVKYANLEVNWENIDMYMLSDITYHIQELEIEDFNL